MKIKCEKCDREATVHLTEIVNGQKIERHLCAECAATEGVTSKVQLPISQLLEEMVLQSSGGKEAARLRCDVCGLSFVEFRQGGLLGCPNDYEVFADVLTDVLERAHEGASQHTGRVPANAAETQRRQAELLRLRAALKQAVAQEDYERAAELRDRIQEVEPS